MNALTELEAEPTEAQAAMPEAEEAKAAKRSFPTVLVAGLGIMVLVLTAAAGMMCYRGRRKTTFEPTNAEQELPAAAADDKQPAARVDDKTVEHLVAARASVVAPEELARPEAGTSESGSKSSSEDSK
jgi:hypothetical protein